MAAPQAESGAGGANSPIVPWGRCPPQKRGEPESGDPAGDEQGPPAAAGGGQVVAGYRLAQGPFRAAQGLRHAVVGLVAAGEQDEPAEGGVDLPDLVAGLGVPELEGAAPGRIPLLVEEVDGVEPPL